jgi:hypothetical protein
MDLLSASFIGQSKTDGSESFESGLCRYRKDWRSHIECKPSEEVQPCILLGTEKEALTKKEEAASTVDTNLGY